MQILIFKFLQEGRELRVRKVLLTYSHILQSIEMASSCKSQLQMTFPHNYLVIFVLTSLGPNLKIYINLIVKRQFGVKHYLGLSCILISI